MLREYSDFGKRTLTLKQLRFALDIDEHECREFKNLKVRILDKAQDEIAATDIPFTYDVEREGRSVKRIVFAFPPAGTATKMTSVSRPLWQQRLIEIGVGNRRIAAVETQLHAGDYDVGYIDYVITIVENQFRKGKIKKPAGAVYKALIEKYLLEDYKSATKPRVIVKKEPLQLSEKKDIVAFQLSEVREMYDNPGPFAQRQKRAATFEEHLQQVYLNDGFVIEQRAGWTGW